MNNRQYKSLLSFADDSSFDDLVRAFKYIFATALKFTESDRNIKWTYYPAKYSFMRGKNNLVYSISSSADNDYSKIDDLEAFNKPTVLYNDGVVFDVIYKPHNLRRAYEYVRELYLAGKIDLELLSKKP